MKRAAITVLGAIALAACARVLGLEGTPDRSFEHHAHLAAGVTCVQCHDHVELAGDSGPLHFPGTATCVGCHRSPHDNRRCGMCHGRPDNAESVADARAHLNFTHRGHARLVLGNCVRCHSKTGDDTASQVPTMGSCLSCHHHRDQFQVRDCEGCHVDLGDERVLPASHVVHGPGFASSHGAQASAYGDLCSSCHENRFCASCHGQTVPALPSRLAFDDPMQASVHRAGFKARHAMVARQEPARCTVCHADSFCRGCHEERGVGPGTAQRSPHPSGWVGPTVAGGGHGRAARLDPFSCAACHGGAGEALCVGCHRVGGPGGNPHPAGFSSRLRMSDRPCRMCHEASGGGR